MQRAMLPSSQAATFDEKRGNPVYFLFNKRKLARLITQYRDVFFPTFRKARPSFFRVLQRMTKVFNVTSLKYGKNDITNEKINNNK